MSLTAAETQRLGRFLNPWALHLQKLGLELKCPQCLNLLNKPMLLPCNHIFCNVCVPKTTQFGSECPACNHRFTDKEVRLAPYIENVVTIYRRLDSTFRATIQQPLSTDAGMLPELSPFGVTKTMEDKSRRELLQNPQEGASNNGKLATLGDAQKEDVEQHGSCVRDANPENQFGLQNEVIDMPQLSPASSNSFSDMKNMDGNRSDPESRNKSFQKSRKSAENESDATRIGDNCITTGDDMLQARGAKRQKKLCYGPPHTSAQSNARAQQGSCTEVAVSNQNMQPKYPAIAQSVATSKSVCAFCHTSKLTEGTGEMLYYANGKEVVGDISNLSKVIPVHKKCIDWTPQVYYEGDNIKNLESELARAAKLKCSSCGVKGAALGCFAKSCRRTYHVPCAFDIHECKWDCDDFLVLCPSHNNVKFPREKSRRAKTSTDKTKPVTCSRTQEHPLSQGHPLAQEHPLSDPISTKQSNSWAALPNGSKEWVLCGSALSSEDKYALVKLANMCGATVTKNWRSSVTHVIAATDANGACSRTLKVLMAILHGRWILTMDWVRACLKANCPVNEESYEVGLDNHGCRDGPKTGRLRASLNAPKLFDGLRFYFSGDFLAAYKYDLLELVRTAGGVIIESKELLVAEKHVEQATSSSSSSYLVVYNRDPPQGCPSEKEVDIMLKRAEDAKELARETGSDVIRHTWILESIAACKLLPLLY